jgi:hypothetical protein
MPDNDTEGAIGTHTSEAGFQAALSEKLCCALELRDQTISVEG